MSPRNAPTVSVIIPTLNEESFVTRAICSVRRAADELIVVDGGSADRTVAVATSCGARVVHGHPGRARQMNAGAAQTHGDVLLFLHADCRLASGAIRHLKRVVAAGPHHAGYFRLCIDGRHPFYRVIEGAANLRARWLRRAYGDQAVFVLRSTFQALGGFPDVPIMEDLLLARALRRFGPLLALPESVMTSPRRWDRDGIVRRVLRNWAVALTEVGQGVSPELAQRYEAVADPGHPTNTAARVCMHRLAPLTGQPPAPVRFVEPLPGR